jgi:hypothetical protein
MYSGRRKINIIDLIITILLPLFRCDLRGREGEPPDRGVAVSRDRVGGSSWHRALVRRRGRRLYVRLDDREVFTAVVGNRTVEDLQQDVLETDGLLWIGEDFYLCTYFCYIKKICSRLHWYGGFYCRAGLFGSNLDV